MQGEIPALALSLRSGLVAEVARTITKYLGVKAREEAAAARSLAEAICCGDLAFEEAVRLLAVSAPAQEWSSLASGSRAGGVFGAVTGDRARADCELAMRRLGQLLVKVFGTAYGCPPPPAPDSPVPEHPPDFGFAALAVAASHMSELKVQALFKDVFQVAHDRAQAMRLSASAPLLDWTRLVAKALDQAIPSLASVERSEEAGRAAAAAWLKANSPIKPAKPKPAKTPPASTAPAVRTTVAALAAALGLPPKAASETKGAFHLRVKQARALGAGAAAPASAAAVVKPPAAAPAPASAPAPPATAHQG